MKGTYFLTFLTISLSISSAKTATTYLQPLQVLIGTILEGERNDISCVEKNKHAYVTMKWSRSDNVDTSNQTKLVTFKTASQIFVTELHYWFIATKSMNTNPMLKLTCTASYEHETVDYPVFTDIKITPSPPVITSGDVVEAGTETTLICESDSGNPPADLSWRVGTKKVKGILSLAASDYETKSAINTLTMTFKPEDDGITIYCDWKYSFSKVIKTDHTKLSVMSAPQITLPLSKYHLTLESNGTLFCDVTANPQIETFNWNKNGKELNTSGDHYIAEHNDKGLILIIINVQQEDEGNYFCSVGNERGSAQSPTMYLNATSVKLVEYKPEPYNVKPVVKAMVGDRIALNCSVIGYPPFFTFQWMFKNKVLTKQEHSSLIIVPTKDDFGLYMCKATNDAGTSEAINITLEEGNENKIERKAVRTVKKVNFGDSTELSCNIRTTDTVYVWKFKKQVLNETSKILRFNVTLDNLGLYSCYSENSTTVMTINVVQIITFRHALTRVAEQSESNATVFFIVPIVLIVVGLFIVSFACKTNKSRTTVHPDV